MSHDNTASSLDLDLPQWRRDIRTFIDSTMSELEEVGNQLSHDLASPQTDIPSSQSRPTMPEVAAAEGDDRLAVLKQKLSNRVKG